jgi:hypothetical protein
MSVKTTTEIRIILSVKTTTEKSDDPATTNKCRRDGGDGQCANSRWPSNGTWIFKIGTLGTGALRPTDFSVIMADADGRQPCNVYWQDLLGMWDLNRTRWLCRTVSKTCTACGADHDRDVNAAVNTLIAGVGK